MSAKGVTGRGRVKVVILASVHVNYGHLNPKPLGMSVLMVCSREITGLTCTLGDLKPKWSRILATYTP